MHPELLHIGSFILPTYGLAFFVSLSMGMLLSYRRSRIEGINENHFFIALFLAFFGIIIMSKVFHIAITWGWYVDNPKRLLDLSRGHAFYGGFIGGITFPLVYLWKVKEPYLPIVDTWMTYTGPGLALHRAIGCMGAGCCYGKPTDMPWGILFPIGVGASKRYGAVYVHPTQLYEALLGMIIFGCLLYWRKYQQKVSGELLALFIAVYSAGRFIIEFFRGDFKRGFYGPMSTSQWLSLVMLSVFALMVLDIRRPRRLQSVQARRESQ